MGRWSRHQVPNELFSFFRQEEQERGAGCCGADREAWRKRAMDDHVGRPWVGTPGCPDHKLYDSTIMLDLPPNL